MSNIKRDSLQCSLPSLGRKVSLGNGWDIRGGRVVAGMVPWNSDTIAEKQVNKTNFYKEILFQKETDSSERAERLSVEANLEVNVLSGMVQVDAGGKYLASQKQSSTTVRLLLDYDSKNYFSTMPFTDLWMRQTKISATQTTWPPWAAPHTSSPLSSTVPRHWFSLRGKFYVERRRRRSHSG